MIIGQKQPEAESLSSQVKSEQQVTAVVQFCIIIIIMWKVVADRKVLALLNFLSCSLPTLKSHQQINLGVTSASSKQGCDENMYTRAAQMCNMGIVSKSGSTPHFDISVFKSDTSGSIYNHTGQTESCVTQPQIRNSGSYLISSS